MACDGERDMKKPRDLRLAAALGLECLLCFRIKVGVVAREYLLPHYLIHLSRLFQYTSNFMLDAIDSLLIFEPVEDVLCAPLMMRLKRSPVNLKASLPWIRVDVTEHYPIQLIQC